MPRPTALLLLLGFALFLTPVVPAHAAGKPAVRGAASKAGARWRAPPPSRRKARKPTKRKPRLVLERRVPALRGNLPNVQALGAYVVDLESGKELYGRKPDQPRAIASISKLAAALVIMDRGLELEGLTTVSKSDVEVARGGAPSRLPAGMTLSNRDLLHAALLGSDNRAVAAIGRAVGLGSTQLAEAMNKKMTALGLKQTRFREPTGLSAENVSTPREVITLLRAAMAHSLLGPVLRRIEYDAHPVGRPAIRYVNTHRPASRSNTEVLGGKTGYNDLARYCLVLAARVGGRSYGFAFLGTEGKMTRFGDVARTADWIVVNKPKLPAPVPAPVAVAGVPVESAPMVPAVATTLSTVATPITAPAAPPATLPAPAPLPPVAAPATARAMPDAGAPAAGSALVTQPGSSGKL